LDPVVSSAEQASGLELALVLELELALGVVFVVVGDLFSIVQQFSIIIKAADKVQYVAVMGLILKLPNVWRYFWIIRHIARIEELQLARALVVREWSGVGFSSRDSP
jgi:hypothetical protein